MKKNILKWIATCFGLFLIIDGLLDRIFNFECVDALLKIFGVKEGLTGVPKWLQIVVAIVVLILIVKYDIIFDYSFRRKNHRKYK